MAEKKGMKHYPILIKERAVQMHLEDSLTIREVSTVLGITDFEAC